MRAAHKDQRNIKPAPIHSGHSRHWKVCFQCLETSAGSGIFSAVMIRKRFLFGLIAVLLGGVSVAESVYPLYANLETEQGSFFAVRPFYSHTVLEEGEVRDYLWPLYSRKSFKDEETSRALILWYTHRFDTDEEGRRHHRWLLPFWFQGRDVNGNDYAALFPAGGTIREFLGRDKISFVLFPIFGKSRINDVKTTSVLWPIYSHTRGEGIRRDRVFPIFGKSVLEGKYEKKFILWPFWTSADYFYPNDTGYSRILFPVYGRAKLDNESTVWVIPPFFRFTDGVKQDRMYCPWPFIQRIKSDWRDKFYLWPLWGYDRYQGGLNHRTFLFWPFLWSERTEQAHLTKTRRMFVPFFYLERSYLKEEGVSQKDLMEVSRYWRIWPLMSWRRETGHSTFRMLELWPIKDAAPVERNWAPLWTLFKRSNDGGVIRKRALWFVWESEQEPEADRKEWSLLKGLAGYKKTADGRDWRLLYLFHFGD